MRGGPVLVIALHEKAAGSKAAIDMGAENVCPKPLQKRRLRRQISLTAVLVGNSWNRAPVQLWDGPWSQTGLQMSRTIAAPQIIPAIVFVLLG